MGNDEVRDVSHQEGWTWKEPLPRVFSNGSSQPMRRTPQTENSWLPDEDSNRRGPPWAAPWPRVPATQDGASTPVSRPRMGDPVRPAEAGQVTLGNQAN